MSGSPTRDREWTVAHVITKLELGGAQRATLDEAEGCRVSESDRHLLFGPGGQLEEEARERSGVRCHVVPSLRREVSPLDDARAVWQMYRYLRRLRTRGPLVVHTHSSKAGILGRWAAYLAGADRVVHSIHGFGHSHAQSTVARGLFGLAERVSARITDGFTADSRANIEQGRREGFISSHPVRVVHCGIELGVFERSEAARARVRDSLGAGADDFVVLNLSCLKPQKDPLTYAEVARRVVDEEPSAKFWLAGDGELRGPLEDKLRALDLSAPEFQLLGWRKDVPDLLSAADALMLTSLWEGLPQTLGQAMAAGLPMIATRVDGTPEAITHGENGYLVEARDTRGYIDAALKLMREAGLAQTMGEKAKQDSERFSRENMLDTLESLYCELGITAG